MLNRFTFLSPFLLCLLLIACGKEENYPEAYGYEVEGQAYIKLKGKRQLAANEPVSILRRKYYEDSLVLQMPSLANGRTKGKDIPVQSGQYAMIGDVMIRESDLLVNLSYENTDNHKIEQISWTGQYRLVKEQHKRQ